MTCQRARVALLQSSRSFQTVDIFKTPLTEEQIRSLAKDQPVSELFSWKSPAARKNGLTPGSRSDAELVQLMAGEPRLVKRPLIRIGDALVVGADVGRIKSLLGDSA